MSKSWCPVWENSRKRPFFHWRAEQNVPGSILQLHLPQLSCFSICFSRQKPSQGHAWLEHLAVLEGAGLDGSQGGVSIESLGPAPLCPGLDTSSRAQVLQSTTWCSPALEALSEQPGHPTWSPEGTAACFTGLPLPALKSGSPCIVCVCGGAVLG